MTTTATLANIDGRKLLIGTDVFVLRKGVDPDQYLPMLHSEVVVEFEEEKGFNMVKDIKPVLPKTEVEDTKGPVDMPPSANVPKLDFNAGPQSYTAVTGSSADFKQTGPVRSQKDIDILTQWSYGQATQSTWAQANDAIALNTEQLKDRIRKLAKWYRDEVLNRNG